MQSEKVDRVFSWVICLAFGKKLTIHCKQAAQKIQSIIIIHFVADHENCEEGGE